MFVLPRCFQRALLSFAAILGLVLSKWRYGYFTMKFVDLRASKLKARIERTSFRSASESQE